MRAVDYAQATGTSSSDAAAGASSNRGPVVAEKVDNPYGSTAGAGSGEFHVYRHARAREMERWKKINANEAEMKAEEEFQNKLAHDTQVEGDKTDKRRRKRERAKEAKRRKKNMRLGGVGDGVSNEQGAGAGEGDDEFEYTPIIAASETEGALKIDQNEKSEALSEENDEAATKDQRKSPPEEENSKLPFVNDGSFLERMKKELANAE